MVFDTRDFGVLRLCGLCRYIPVRLQKKFQTPMFEPKVFVTLRNHKLIRMQTNLMSYDTTANGSYPISSMTDEFGTEYAYSYSDENKVTTVTEVVEDGTPRITTQAYDDKKYITTETFPDGKTQVIEYHLIDGENKYGEPAKITDRNGNVTEYERDDNGNVIKTINPDGTISEALYDDKNNVVWTLDETGVFTRYTYDDYKINLLKQSVYLEKLASDDTKPELIDSNTDDFITVQYSYADLPYKGLVSSMTDGNGNTTSYTYDSSYNLESVINPESNTEEPIVTRYEYNTMGLKSAEISPTGNRTEYQYDNNGNITQKKVITDGGTEITQYLYDLNGNVIAEKAPNQVAQNGNGVVYTYYPSGKLHTKTDAAGYVYTYTYDKYGNISSITNPDGSIKSYEYDSVNRQIAEHFKESANSTAVLISETSYAVSDNNEIVTIKKYIDDTNYLTDISVYDYDGKLVSHSVNGIVDETNIYYGNRLLKNSTDGNGNDVHYTYFNHDSSTDELYDEKWIEVSDGLYSYEKVVYDLAGNVTKILKSTSPVALNTVPSQNLIIEEYQYYKDNLLKQATDNEGRKIIYTYDANRHMSGAEQYYSNTGKNVVKVAYDHMEENELEFSKHRFDFLWFANHVKTGALVDVKNSNDNFKRSPKSYHIIYDNVVFRADAPGNIAYGYLGKAAGFSDGILLYGAGIYQTYSDIKMDTKESVCKVQEKSILKSVLSFDLSDEARYLWNYVERIHNNYGDNPGDPEQIMKGIEIYNIFHS